jgi:hypothetical protein
MMAYKSDNINVTNILGRWGLTIGVGYTCPTVVKFSESISYRAASSRASQVLRSDGQAMLKCTRALARRESHKYFVDKRKIPETIRKSS